VDQKFSEVNKSLGVKVLKITSDGDSIDGTRMDVLAIRLKELEGELDNDAIRLEAKGNIDVILQNRTLGRYKVTLHESVDVKPGVIKSHMYLVQPRLRLCIQGRTVWVDACSFNATVTKAGNKSKFDVSVYLKVTVSLPCIFRRIGNRIASNALHQTTCQTLSQTVNDILCALCEENPDTLDLATMFLKTLKKVGLEDDAVVKVKVRGVEVKFDDLEEVKKALENKEVKETINTIEGTISELKE